MKPLRINVCLPALALSALFICPAAAQTASNFPALKSPIAAFRELLAAPAEEQARMLAIRPPEIRERLLAKLNEYRVLPPELRDLRLVATELRWYLLQLMNTDSTNRVAQLALIPSPMRELVTDRIQRWEILPPPLRQQMLDSGEGISYLGSVDDGSGAAHALSEYQRRELRERFDRFIRLTAEERDKALHKLSEAERRQMEVTLDKFGSLSDRQRELCVLSFAKFADMADAERQQFLRNAERWSQMSETERKTWRELVDRVPNLPPLPRGLIRASQASRASLSGGLAPRVATNGL